MIYAISVGSNIGDAKKNIKEGIIAVDGKLGSVFGVSRFYNTKAWGKTDQADFVNAAFLLGSELPPPVLMLALKDLEKVLGRVESERWGPRLIDFDIIFADAISYSDEIVTIPHPRAKERQFVVEPLVDLVPDFVHPEWQKPLKQILMDLKQSANS